MSTVKTNNVQIGQSLTATNNGTWYQPATPDGTIRYGIGNAGATTTDVVTLSSSGLSTTALVVSGSTAPTNGMFLPTTNTLAWSTNSTERLRLDSSGNLGLGVTPSGWGSGKAVEVGYNGNAVWSYSQTDSYLTHNAKFTDAWRYNATAAASTYRQSAGAHYWNTAPSGTAGNAISFTQAMTLDASGNLLVGTTSLTPTNGGVVTYGGLSGTEVWAGHASGTSGGVPYYAFYYAGSRIGSITQNGTSQVLYNTSSDQRLKENVADAPSALSSVNAIKVRSFDWKSDGSHVDYGYIAQELLEVVPEAVSVPADPEEMMGVDFGKLTPRLVKAIQELSAQVTTLQAEINALKA